MSSVGRKLSLHSENEAWKTSKEPSLTRRSLGAAAIVFGLPVLLHAFAFACNDVAGCPVPSLLDPRNLTWETLRAETGWPENGIWDLASWEATGLVLAYYLVSLVLYRILPAQEVRGTKLKHHDRALTYRFNGEAACR